MAGRDPPGQAAGQHLPGQVLDVERSVGGQVGLLVDVQVDRQAVPLGDVEHPGDLAVRVGREVRAAADDVDAARDGLGDQGVTGLVVGEQAHLQRHPPAQPFAQRDQGVEAAERVALDQQVDVRADGGDAVGEVAAHGRQGARADVGAVDPDDQRPPGQDGGGQVVAGAEGQARRGEGLVQVRVRLAGGGEHAPARRVEGDGVGPGAGVRAGQGARRRPCRRAGGPRAGRRRGFRPGAGGRRAGRPVCTPPPRPSRPAPSEITERK